MRRTLPIAVLDSGAGGLSVLPECLVSRPPRDFVCLGTRLLQLPLGEPERIALAPARRPG